MHTCERCEMKGGGEDVPWANGTQDTPASLSDALLLLSLDLSRITHTLPNLPCLPLRATLPLTLGSHVVSSGPRPQVISPDSHPSEANGFASLAGAAADRQPNLPHSTAV